MTNSFTSSYKTISGAQEYKGVDILQVYENTV